MGVYLGSDYSAMRGPCPEGFHVPLSAEQTAVYNILANTFGVGAMAMTYLKMPLAGLRNVLNAWVSGQGEAGRYWSASPRENGASATGIVASSSSFTVGRFARTSGASIRGFKDVPVAPDSSWTTLYDGSSTAAGAGIFHNSTLGLISISGDGTNWITIADKNLGATTVYNSGDTLSEANCGKYYQRGNNYGFPFAGTGSVTTSSTKVDASSYGPGNYYSSSTFIVAGSNPERWDTTDNGNLRGGETGIAPAELKNAYIGIPNPTSIVLDKSSITLTTVGQTEQLTATIEPTVSDKTITWSSDDTTVATVSTTGLVTCVTPGSCTITATTVNGLTASCSVGQGRLPSSYQEVEYIGTSGTQRINTGLFAGTNIQTETKIELTTTEQNIPVFGGFKNTAEGITTGNYYHLTPYGGNWYYGKNNSEAHAGTYSATVGTTYEIVYNNSNSKISINGSEIGDTTGTTLWTGATLAMALRGDSVTKNYGKYKYFYFKMYNKTTGEYERDFVPCYRKSDSVIGMYDIVNDVFYTNSGSGTFTKGPDV